MLEGEGFEPSKAEPPDLQSSPFDRSGTPPVKNQAAYFAEITRLCQQMVSSFFYKALSQHISSKENQRKLSPIPVKKIFNGPLCCDSTIISRWKIFN